MSKVLSKILSIKFVSNFENKGRYTDKKNFIRRGEIFFVGCDSGYDDVDEEMNVSEANFFVR